MSQLELCKPCRQVDGCTFLKPQTITGSQPLDLDECIYFTCEVGSERAYFAWRKTPAIIVRLANGGLVQAVPFGTVNKPTAPVEIYKQLDPTEEQLLGYIRRRKILLRLTNRSEQDVLRVCLENGDILWLNHENRYVATGGNAFVNIG